MVGQASHFNAPARVSQELASRPIPLIILARLAMDKTEQVKRIGMALLKDALYRSARAADITVIRVLFVHPKDDEAIKFYERFNCRPSPTDPHHLFLLMKDILKITAI